VKQAECHAERKHYAKGLCAPCYSKRVRQRGWRSPTKATCHPERMVKARGLCSPCYQAGRANPGFVPSKRRRGPCVNHPDRPAEGHGLCKSCYCAWRRKSDPNRDARERQRDRAAWYGLTLEQFEQIKSAQGGCCAICEKRLGRRGTYHIDHCHRTNRVRGILCSGCNRAIGMLGDTAAGVMRAVSYLRMTEHGIVLELPGEIAA
jgi:hypothetical protein